MLYRVVYEFEASDDATARQLQENLGDFTSDGVKFTARPDELARQYVSWHPIAKTVSQS